MLSGIKILDATRLLPGPLATLLLADLGADVIKLEDTLGDYVRTLPPYLKTMSPLFVLLNRNKRSVCVEWKMKEARPIIEALIANTDVFIESFKPGTLKNYGWDYEKVKKINPSIIYVSVTGYGQQGSRSVWAGHDLNFLGYSGILHHLIKHLPTIPPIQIGDILGGSMMTVIAVLAAYIHKLKTSEGQYIDISMLDGLMYATPLMLHSYLAMQTELPPGHDLLTGAMPFYDVYPTQDNRYMVVAAIESKFWKIFCEAMELHEWKPKQYVFGNEAQQLRQIITERFLQRTQSEWTAFFEPLDCCVTPVLTYHEALQNTDFFSKQTLIHQTHPTEGVHLALGIPFQTTTFAQINTRIPAPKKGEHTSEILQQIGFSQQNIEQFRQLKLII